MAMLAADSPERAAVTALDLGGIEDQPVLISGKDLDGLSRRQYLERIKQGTVFGDLTPASKANIVKSLHAREETVVMVGSAVGDIPALRQADLRICLKGGSQAAMQMTDIVLLENSIGALPHVLTTGQRLVNGVLDTFKLYLSHTIAHLLLIVSLAVFIFLRPKPISTTGSA